MCEPAINSRFRDARNGSSLDTEHDPCQPCFGNSLRPSTEGPPLPPHRSIRTRCVVQRAEKAGYGALAVTVDAPRLGRREADIRNGCAREYVRRADES